MTGWSEHPNTMRAARQLETDVRFRMVTDETMPGIEPEDYVEPDHCRCENPTGHTLAIEDGGITIVHTACGKKPWFLYDDSIECVSMDPIPIKVNVATCPPSSHYYEYGICDCGPEITLTPEGN